MKTATTALLILLLSLSYQNLNAQRLAVNETTVSINKMIQTVETIKAELQRCDTEMCEIILRNAGARQSYLTRALQAFEAKQTDLGLKYVSETKRIVESDVDRLSSARLDNRMNLVFRYEQDLFNQIEQFQTKMSSQRIEY